MTIKCANCDNEAIYTCADPGVNPVDYCGECLPSWMEDRAKANHFPLVIPSAEKTSKKKAEATEAPASEDN